jgi:hypothetical protein
MIEAISHITIIVKDLEMTGRFFRIIFDAKMRMRKLQINLKRLRLCGLKSKNTIQLKNC